MELQDLIFAFAGAVILYHSAHIVYNVYFHPLSKYPGYPLWTAFRWPFIYSMWNGRLPYDIHQAHQRYGNVVRLAPDELSFVDPQAWMDVYSNRDYVRPKIWASQAPGVKAHSLITAPTADHARLRKALGPAFTENAVKLYEPLIKSKIELLFTKIQDQMEVPSERQVSINLVQWISFTTFDIISELGWGTSFDCLGKREFHPWIVVVQQYKARLFAVIMRFYPYLQTVASYLTPASAMNSLKLVGSFGARNVAQRLERKPTDPDFMSYVVAYNEANPKVAINREELVQNSVIMIIAGSDPVTTVTCGVLHHVLKYPKWLQHLYKELDEAFESEEHISAASTRSLPVLNAIIKEAMRLCPPTPDSMRRLISTETAQIAGHTIPTGTTVGVSCFAIFRTPENFSYPDEFCPERWLEPGHALSNSSRFKAHSNSAFQPFGAGTRRCLGSSLAWVELRLIVAKLLYKYELQIPADMPLGEWTSQEVYWTWKKEAINVHVRPRKS